VVEEIRDDVVMSDENGIDRGEHIQKNRKKGVPKGLQQSSGRCLDINYFASWALGKEKNSVEF
jgi:hypothetical protein